MITTLEQTLLLRRHRPGTLVALDRYLHDRTDGMIGALSHQIRGAAINAILTRAEQVTQAGLETVPLDFTAQKTTTNRSRRPRNGRTGP